MNYPQHTLRNNGFSLIELMIVIVVIVILASVAVPSYQNHVIKTHRTEAKTALVGLAQAIERYHVKGNTYLGSHTSGVPDIHPSEVTSSGRALYDLTITTPSASQYTLRATPKGSQSGDGYLELNHLGQKSWQKYGGTVVNNWDD